MQMARTKQFWKTRCDLKAYARAGTHMCAQSRPHAAQEEQDLGRGWKEKTVECEQHATQANINKKKQCAKKMRRLIKTSLKRKTADFFLCLHNPNLATYLMPVEGRESSAKVWETIFQPHASRNPGEREREPAIGKHEYSALNLHVLSSSSSGPLVPCSVDCRYNQLCK